MPRPVAKAVAAELLHAEMLLLDPRVRRDRARVSTFLAEDFQEFGASGRAWSRDQILDLLETETYDPPVVEDFACCRIDDKVILVTYRAVRAAGPTGSRQITLRSSLWSKKSDKWLMRFHQGTRAM
jgi:glyoxylase I family protein